MDLCVPSVGELVMMSPVGVERVAHELEVVRRRVEAASALLVQRVDQVRGGGVGG